MNACTSPRGIFSLRPCGAEASDTCSSCGRALCQEHVLYRSTRVFCSRCAGQESPADSSRPPAAAPASIRPGSSGKPDDPNTPEWDRPGWADRYRTNYYAASSFHPVVSYDDYDRRSFDERADLGGDDVPDGSAGFGDS